MMTPPIGGMAPDLNANPMQSMFAQAPQIPTEIAPRGGMFGGNMQMAMMAAISALMARKHPQVSQMMQGMMQQRMSQQEFQQHRQQQLQDEKDMFDYRAQHSQPEMGEFERALQASGVQPGTPQWQQAMKRRSDNMLDPIVNTIQGPVLRSMVTQGMQLPTQPVGPLTPIDEDGGAGQPAPRPFPY